MEHIYLDYAATTPLDPLVLEAMIPFFREEYGNPSSIHRFGQRADASLETARERMADLLHGSPRQVIFTSGGTESDNLALKGAALSARNSRGADQIFITPVEHPAVEKTALDLEKNFGFKVNKIPVDSTGKVILDEVRSRLSHRTAVVSVIYANNEIGTINPIAEIAGICHEKGILFHTDAVQAAGSCLMDTNQLQADFISIGAHKFYGPKGVGVLFCRDLKSVTPTQTGGAQEWGIRAGTQNVPLIIGLVKAFELALKNQEEVNRRNLTLRDEIIRGVLQEIPDAKLTGHPIDRLPNHASFIFPDTDGNQLVILLDQAGFACSSGSACKTGSPEPSTVLIEIGIPALQASGSLRITIGKYTDREQIASFLSVLPDLVQRARRNS